MVARSEFTRCRAPAPEIPRLAVDIAMDDGSTEIVRKSARAMSGIIQADLERC
jgi:hypothetical protein